MAVCVLQEWAGWEGSIDVAQFGALVEERGGVSRGTGTPGAALWGVLVWLSEGISPTTPR